jgi:hypothetical protein
MAGAIQLFPSCLFVIGDAEQKRPRQVISSHCLSELWMIVFLPSEWIGFGIQDK